MRVVLVIASDAATRRAVADALLSAGFGVCETHTSELVPAVPRLDAVVCTEGVDRARFGAPIVAIPRPLDREALLARLRVALATEEREAA